MALIIDNQPLNSRFLLGTAGYPSLDVMKQAIQSSKAQIITVSIRRESMIQGGESRFWDYIKDLKINILPNTAHCYSAKEAILTAKLARELFGTSWIKLEVIGNHETLQPDPIETVVAARELLQDGFQVFPYITDDLVICEKLVKAGCKILMPWGSPIGTGQGIKNPDNVQMIRQYFPETTLIIDAGIGKPSHAALAMELGADAVLINTAVACAIDPVAMAKAFGKAIEAGRDAFKAGMIAPKTAAMPSTPIFGKPIWHFTGDVK